MGEDMNGRFGNDRLWAVRVAAVRLIAAASSVLLFCGIASAQTALDRARRDETVSVPTGNAAMEAAFAKARATLDGFLALLDKPPPDTDIYTVKLRIVDPGNRAVEFFWVGNLERTGDDRFSGRIDNTPRSVTTVRNGQVVRFTRAEIYDWMYVDYSFINGKRRMVGNFTLCAILTREKPEEAAAVKRETGLVCD
jgi:uncharacterized protein YegJ (DUF2314 family)